MIPSPPYRHPGQSSRQTKPTCSRGGVAIRAGGFVVAAVLLAQPGRAVVSAIPDDTSVTRLHSSVIEIRHRGPKRRFAFPVAEKDWQAGQGFKPGDWFATPPFPMPRSPGPQRGAPFGGHRREMIDAWWREHRDSIGSGGPGSVPEPTVPVLAMLGSLGLWRRRRGPRRRSRPDRR